jgi:general secretion pathway protein K
MATARYRLQNGFALIVVLNIVAILSGIAIVASQASREGAAIAANFRSDAQQKSLAEGVMAVAVDRLLAVEPGRRWLPDGRPYHIMLFNEEAVVSVQDESGKFSLNSVDEATLARAFANSGIETSKASSLAAAIADWCDADNERRLGGAERSDYLSAGITGSPANGRFRRNAELRGVLGVTDEVYRRMNGIVTAYSLDSSVNFNVAPLAVLNAMFGPGSPEVAAVLARRSDLATGLSGGPTNLAGLGRSDGLTRQVGSAGTATYSIVVALPGPGNSSRLFEGAFRIGQDRLGPRLAVIDSMALVESAAPH